MPPSRQDTLAIGDTKRSLLGNHHGSVKRKGPQLRTETKKESQKTRGQAEREISQRLRSLYKELLGHRLSEITCQLFAESLAIVLENSITQPEKRLLEAGNDVLITQVHSTLSKSMEPEIRALVEDVLAVAVIDIMNDATLETGRTGIIIKLAERPRLRRSANNNRHERTSSGTKSEQPVVSNKSLSNQSADEQQQGTQKSH